MPLINVQRPPKADTHTTFWHGTRSMITCRSIFWDGGRLRPGEDNAGAPKKRGFKAIWFASKMETSLKYAKSRQPQIVFELTSRSSTTHVLRDSKGRKWNHWTVDEDGVALRFVLMR
eukprot:9050771-Karenia_brevis.AAC.1